MWALNFSKTSLHYLSEVAVESCLANTVLKNTLGLRHKVAMWNVGGRVDASE